jgi:hypothetical protein
MIIQINYLTSSLNFLFKGKLLQEKHNQFQRINKQIIETKWTSSLCSENDLSVALF